MPPTPDLPPESHIEKVITKEDVVKSLLSSPTNISVLTSFIDMRQKQVQAPYKSSEDVEKDTFAFCLELAEIYRDAKLLVQAFDAYNDAADVAEANGMEKEYLAILEEMKKL